MERSIQNSGPPDSRPPRTAVRVPASSPASPARPGPLTRAARPVTAARAAMTSVIPLIRAVHTGAVTPAPTPAAGRSARLVGMTTARTDQDAHGDLPEKQGGPAEPDVGAPAQPSPRDVLPWKDQTTTTDNAPLAPSLGDFS